MNLVCGEIANLAAGEIWTQEVAGSLPGSAVRGEDPMTEKRDESVFSAVSESPFFEVHSQDSLNIFGLECLHEVGEEELHVRVVSISQKSSSVMSH